MSTDAFTSFVNTELPKRISTNQSPLDVQPGMVFVTTGVGLSTEPLPYGTAGISTDEGNALKTGTDGKLFSQQFEWTTTQW